MGRLHDEIARQRRAAAWLDELDAEYRQAALDFVALMLEHGVSPTPFFRRSPIAEPEELGPTHRLDADGEGWIVTGPYKSRPGHRNDFLALTPDQEWALVIRATAGLDERDALAEAQPLFIFLRQHEPIGGPPPDCVALLAHASRKVLDQ